MPNTPKHPLAVVPLAVAPATRAAVLPLPFRCTFSRRGGVGAAWVTAAGELDLADAADLERVLRDALASARLVVLDLRALSFVDLAGVHAIVDASVRAVCDGRRLLVAFAPAHVVRVLALAGASDAVEMLDLPIGARLRLLGRDAVG